MNPKGILLIVGALGVLGVLAGIFFFTNRLQDAGGTSPRPSSTTTNRNQGDQSAPQSMPPIPSASNNQNTPSRSPSTTLQNPNPGVAHYETYTNINFKFSLKYPPNYKFQESFRNYYYINTNDDPGERVYMFSWNRNEVSSAGAVGIDKIVLSVYAEGYEPNYRIDKNSKEEKVKIDGQDVKKRYGENGKIITVGPIIHNGRTLVFQNELANPDADQTVFNNMLSTMRLLK